MRVGSLIAGKGVATISAGASLNDLVNALHTHQVGALVVSSDGKHIEGMVSERDVVRALPGRLDELTEIKVRDLMSREVVTCTSDTSVHELMTTMTEQRIRHIPVVGDDGALLSIVSIGDVVKSYVSAIETERQSLQDYLNS